MMTTIHMQTVHVLKPDSPTFVGSHYYCESGNIGGIHMAHYILVTNYGMDWVIYLKTSCCYDAEMP